METKKSLKNEINATRSASADPGATYVKSFRHWRSGKIIRAEEYGLQAFRFGSRRRR